MVVLATKIYLESMCTGLPNAVYMTAASDCDAGHTCSELKEDNGNAFNTSVSCISDRFQYTTEVFGSSNFVIVEHYNTTGCQDLLDVAAFPASELCQAGGSFMMTASLDDVTGAVNITYYKGDTCSVSPERTVSASSTNVSSRDSEHCIIDGKYKIYSSYSLNNASKISSNGSSQAFDARGDTSTSPETLTLKPGYFGVSVDVIVGVVVAGFVVVFGILWYLRRKGDEAGRDLYSPPREHYLHVSLDVGR